MKVLDLFSGIGGFSLGLERAGMETVAFVEIDPACQKVLKKHWPDVPVFADIKITTKAKLDEYGITTIDIICGGFPCTDISACWAGPGLSGSRSGLWFEYARLIGEIQPKYVIIENVANLVKRGLDTVIENLAELGYSAAWGVLAASICGAPHERERLYIVAWRDWTPILFADDCGPCDGCGEPFRADCSEHYAEGACPGPHSDDDGWRLSEETFGFVAYPDVQRCKKQWGACAVSEKQFSTELYRWWAAEPAVGRVVNGLPGRVDRIKQLGNTVIPFIPELIGLSIMQREAA